jgi:hypothetical protein
LKKEIEENPEKKKENRWYVGITFNYRRSQWFLSVKDRYEIQKINPKVEIEIHVLRIGDIVFATNPFELYLDYGMRIKARSKAIQTFIVQLAGSGTYLPVERSVKGGALGIGVGDRILMQEYSIYSVISPEGCASILWKTQEGVEEAAKALKLTARDLFELKIIDEIIPEPLGGAHSDWEATFKLMKEAIERNLKELKTIKIEELVELRYKKYRKIGVFLEGEKGE